MQKGWLVGCLVTSRIKIKVLECFNKKLEQLNLTEYDELKRVCGLLILQCILLLYNWSLENGWVFQYFGIYVHERIKYIASTV